MHNNKSIPASELSRAEILMIPLGQRIRYYRDLREMTALELANAIGLGGDERSKRVAISNYETGRRNPSAPVLHSITRALGVGLEELTGGALADMDQQPVEIQLEAGAIDIPKPLLRRLPLPPSDVKAKRQVQASLRKAVEILTQEQTEGKSVESGLRSMAKAQKEIIAALDALDKLGER